MWILQFFKFLCIYIYVFINLFLIFQSQFLSSSTSSWVKMDKPEARSFSHNHDPTYILWLRPYWQKLVMWSHLLPAFWKHLLAWHLLPRRSSELWDKYQEYEWIVEMMVMWFILLRTKTKTPSIPFLTACRKSPFDPINFLVGACPKELKGHSSHKSLYTNRQKL